jgi:hypothetical protein
MMQHDFMKGRAAPIGNRRDDDNSWPMQIRKFGLGDDVIVLASEGSRACVTYTAKGNAKFGAMGPAPLARGAVNVCMR